MGVWVECAACGLKHTARLDGECPRCRAEAGSTVQVIPVLIGRAAARSGAAQDAAKVRRLAAAALFLHGASALGAVLVGGFTTLNAAALAVGVVVDLALGVALLGEGEWPRLAALVRAGVGAGAAVVLTFAPHVGPLGDTATLRGIMRACLFAGLLVLLAGSAGPARRRMGALLAFVPYLVLKLVCAAEPAMLTGDLAAAAADFVLAFLGAA